MTGFKHAYRVLLIMINKNTVQPDSVEFECISSGVVLTRFVESEVSSDTVERFVTSPRNVRRAVASYGNGERDMASRDFTRTRRLN